MMPENKEIPNRDGYVTFYLGNKKIIHDPKLTIKNAMMDEAVKSPKHYKLPGLNIESIDVLRSVLVRDNEDEPWTHGYFAFYSGGQVWTFMSGSTSWSVEDPNFTHPWNFAKIANDEEEDDYE